MSKYQDSHYEDVAAILLEHILLSHVSPMNRDLVNTFADLFAADNPPFCNAIPYPYDHDRHDCVEGGFNREQFLAACGLS